MITGWQFFTVSEWRQLKKCLFTVGTRVIKASASGFFRKIDPLSYFQSKDLLSSLSFIHLIAIDYCFRWWFFSLFNWNWFWSLFIPTVFLPWTAMPSVVDKIGILYTLSGKRWLFFATRVGQRKELGGPLLIKLYTVRVTTQRLYR